MSDDEGTFRRSSRDRTAGRLSGKQAALEALKAARRSGVTHRADLDTIDRSIFEEVDEDEYERIQAGRQSDFIVGDVLGEYRDDGRELDDLDGEDSNDEEEERKKRKEKREKKRKKGGLEKFLVANVSSNRDAKMNLPSKQELDDMLNTLNDDDDDEEEEVKENFMSLRPVQQRNPFKRKLSEQPIENDLLAPAAPTVEHIAVQIEEVELEDTKTAEPIAKKVKHEEILETVQVKPEPEISDIDMEVKPDSEGWLVGELDSQEAMNDSPLVEDDSEISTSEFVLKKEGNLLTVRMYYVDAFEDSMKHPGTVYLFGRVQDKLASQSCCIILKNIPRQFFVMFQQDSKMAAYEELRQHTDRMGIKEFKCRVVKMKITFDSAYDPQEEYEVLEVAYSTQYPKLPTDMKGNYIGKVYNTTSTALEQVLVEQKIKGPGWLDIHNLEKPTRNASYCKFEFVLDVGEHKLKSLEYQPNEAKPAPIAKLFAINLVTTLNAAKENEIAMISVLFDYSCDLTKPNTNLKTLKRFTMLRKLPNSPYDFDQFVSRKGRSGEIHAGHKNEKSLLNQFLMFLGKYDPDVLIGHDISNIISVLVSRLDKLQIREWSRTSRLRRTVAIQKLGHSKAAHWEFTAGRLVIDSKSVAMELVRLRSYDLEELVPALLNESKVNVLPSEVSSKHANSATLLNFIDWSYKEAQFALRIVAQLSAIPLFMQITNIVGGVMSRTLMGGRAERNEFLLLHAFKEKSYIAPDKYVFNLKAKKGAVSQNVDENGDDDEGGKSKKAQYAGGLVLEPKKGLYDTYIVLLDFNSLYPSIIQEYNICFTTVDQSNIDPETGLPVFPNGTGGTGGILPHEIRTLVNSRREVKNRMKTELNPAKQQQNDIRQLGLKLTANSMYGCLGFDRSRFHAKPLAAMITAKGREILTATKDIVEKHGFSVIYGDTDSIMVNTNSIDFQEALKIGAKIKQLVNKSYRLLELDLDGIFVRLLLCKKKKYAALTADLKKGPTCTKPELKGLDIVRRDWSGIAKEAGTKAVDIILSTKNSRDDIVSEINELLCNLRTHLDAGNVPIEKFEILKQLTRNPSEYKDLKSQAHAIVAQRLNETGKYHFRSGDIVKYIICEDGSGNSAMQRAYHQSEINENKELKIDIHYYLSQQIHPVVSRLCEPIEETDAGRIAESLGLDPSGYRRRAAVMKSHDDNDNFTVGLKHDFTHCDSFKFICPNAECENSKRETLIRGVLCGRGLEARFALEECDKCKTPWAAQYGPMLVNQLEKVMLENITKYMMSPYVCDDPVCNYEASVIGQDFLQNGCTCVRCNIGTMHKTYSSKALFDQQLFYKLIFNLQDAFNNAGADEKKVLQARSNYEKVREVYSKLSAVVARYMEGNEFSTVDLNLLFAPMAKPESMLNRFKKLRIGLRED